MPTIPPFYFGTCEDCLSLWSFATLCGLEVKTGPSSQWERRLEAALGSRLTFLKWLSTTAGDEYRLVHSVNKMLCVLPPPTPPPLYVSFCPMHSCPVLNWSLVMRTVCATHTLGSAVRGNGSIVTIITTE